jgi:DNA polymerase-4
MAAIIVHVDVDAFFASVEQRDRPELRERAIAVGGPPERRGVIAAASYEARKFGVRSAMPSRTALERCPHLLILPPRFEVYRAASRQIMDILRAHAGGIEPVSLDEAFLDITDQVTEFDKAVEYAYGIKEAVRAATQLTVSLGVATNKLVAKIASDRDKPDGFTVVRPGEERAFLAPLPVRAIWGIGPRTEARLLSLGIERIGQLADADDNWIMQRLGLWGFQWRSLARGKDSRPVIPSADRQQVSREVTFDRDTTDMTLLRETLLDMARDISTALERLGPARTVQIKLRYADFQTVTRQLTPPKTITTSGAIFEHALVLLDRGWDRRPLRLLGVGVSNFLSNTPEQLKLFEV